MTAPKTRRNFLIAGTGMAASAASLMAWHPAEALQHTPSPLPSPNAPRNPNVPGGMDQHPTDGAARQPTESINAAQIATMVHELYEMALALQRETDQTNLRNTLPVDFIKRAKDIEKLAKSIREHARG